MALGDTIYLHRISEMAVTLAHLSTSPLPSDTSRWHGTEAVGLGGDNEILIGRTSTKTLEKLRFVDGKFTSTWQKPVPGGTVKLEMFASQNFS